MGKLRMKIVAILIMAIIVQMCVPPQKVDAAVVKSKSITVTFDEDNTYHSFRIKLSKETFAMAKIKILKVTGKAKKQGNGKIYWGAYSCEDGIGSYFYSLKPKDFKKGKVLKSEDGVWKDGGVTFSLPSGIKKLKVKITFFTQDNSKSIDMIKETDVEDYYMGYK